MTTQKPRSAVRRFLHELRRRRVVESTGLYLAGTWLTIEVASTLQDPLGYPGWVVQAVIAAAVVGLPFIVFLAWRYDISLGGLIRTGDAEQPASRARSEDAPSRSIAVLPFENLSQDAENEYFSDGVAEEVLNLLSKVPGLKVAARTSSFAFREKKIDIRDAAAALGVRNVLEGSVRRAGDRVRITAQLIEAPTGFHLWSETFDREIEDIFAVQDEIAGAILEALKLALAKDEDEGRDPAQLPTENIEAYQYFLRANYLWQRRGKDAIAGAINALETAVELDPGFARAYARLAAARAILHEYTGSSREDDFAVSEALALKSIALDDSLGEPHAVIGYIALRIWHWEDSEKAFVKALERDPTNPIVHQWYCNLLNDFGRHDDALKEAETAHGLDRLSPSANNVLALTQLFLGNDELALKHAAIAREYGMGGPVPSIIQFIVHLRSRDFASAQRAWTSQFKRSGRDGPWIAHVVGACEDNSRMGAALAALSELEAREGLNKNELFLHYVVLGQADAAYELAQKLLADHSLNHLWLLLPDSAGLRADSRFEPLMHAMGLSDYWEKSGRPGHLG